RENHRFLGDARVAQLLERLRQARFGERKPLPHGHGAGAVAEADDYDRHVRKSEVRNPKSEGIPKSEARMIQHRRSALFGFRFSGFFRISDFGFGFGSWMVKRRQEVNAPEGQEHEDERADSAKGEAASALSKLPTH